MINVSEMYRISGGCTIGHTCSDCDNYIDGKLPTCIIYPKNYGRIWNGKRLACKRFREKTEGQMSFERNFPEMMP